MPRRSGKIIPAIRDFPLPGKPTRGRKIRYIRPREDGIPEPYWAPWMTDVILAHRWDRPTGEEPDK